ncbi:MAG: flippase [Candidatus Magasanikiibacteriota bacterium]
MPNSVAKNTAFITFAYVGQKIISFVYFTLIIAKNLGVENTGKYFFVLSFTTIFVVFVDLGLTNVLVRESAKLKEKTQNYFSTILSVKIILALLSYIGAFITINLLGYPVEIKHLVYLSAVTMLFDSLHLSIYGVMRALGNLKYEAWGIVGSQFITLIMGSYAIYTHKPLIYLILAFVVPSFLNVCYASVMLYKNYQIKLKPQFDKFIFKYLFKIAVPFALTAIFARVYSYIDSIILSKLAGNIAVGWYSIPYKITFAFQFIPMALVAALYPRFSEFFVSDKNKLVFYFEKSIKYLSIIVFPIAFGIIILSHDLVLSLTSAEFLPSVLPLQILMFSLIFSFLSFPIGAFLNACNRQNQQMFLVFGILVLNVVLNLFLIPIWGVVGAALSALAGNVLLTLVGYILVNRIVLLPNKFILKDLFLLFISAVVMGLAVWYVNMYWHYIFAIVAGTIVYSVMLFVTKSITRNQIQEALLLIKK